MEKLFYNKGKKWRETIMWKVKNKEMFHYHKLGIYDEMWQEGQTIQVDETFCSQIGAGLD